MNKFKFSNITIKGIGSVVGNNCIHINDEVEFYESEKQLEKLKKTIGFDTRYVVTSDITAYDLGVAAISNLLKSARIDVDSIDAIISVTQTPDHYMPGNAHKYHRHFGFSKDCFALDIECGCSGFIYGLFNASMMINSGCKRVLIVSGDALSSKINIKNRADAPVFGDAVTATLVEYSENAGEINFVLHSDGSGFDHMCQRAGGFRNPSNEETRKIRTTPEGYEYCLEDFYMNGFEVFNFTMREQPSCTKEILEYSKLNVEDIDYFVFHQANKYIVNTIARGSKIPLEKVPTIGFTKYGNSSSGTIPVTICEALSDDICNGRKKCLLQGYGIGLSWGACILDLDHVDCAKPEVYKVGE